MHDFVIPELGRAAHYGVYDLAQNIGWVRVGVDHDTASFAVETIRRWWHAMGKEKYPQAQQLLITADGGGSNGSRLRLWKLELQTLADETGLSISVRHFPPGTSKWNKIERRFVLLHQQELARAASHQLKGDCVSLDCWNHDAERAESPCRDWMTGPIRPASKLPMRRWHKIHLRRDAFHGEWNYEIMPRDGIVIP